jgi:hypothetical protein
MVSPLFFGFVFSGLQVRVLRCLEARVVRCLEVRAARCHQSGVLNTTYLENLNVSLLKRFSPLLVRRIPFFLDLIPYSLVHTRLLSARACRRQHNGQSAKPLAIAGVVPRLYPSAEFHRQATTDEQHTVPVAYQLHCDVRRRSFLFDAVEPHTQGKTYATITLLNAKYSLYFSATEFHRQP